MNALSKLIDWIFKWISIGEPLKVTTLEFDWLDDQVIELMEVISERKSSKWIIAPKPAGPGCDNTRVISTPFDLQVNNIGYHRFLDIPIAALLHHHERIKYTVL